ncbi:outer membrane protein assembly factor BamD [Pseudomethylobacillus aquaticus]|uniref:Outer membrane protein assembly factor BamD n=1 Tax=Pseudomethylobacillus aquaticus TaxID=2676064 RepID=A0A3N0UY73_9PROT|nr:outer membrane protein assembly factor BamD [Pseudomethylobacillus aquaticus]ROH85445.1 outer membrane protein assembly factor BamD [Pseudomethylobacillus aquaticus]
MKHSVALFALLWLTGCAIFGDPAPLDVTKGWNVQRIYSEAQAAMSASDYEKAISYFRILESRYPHGRFATQSQLEVIYAYHKKNEPPATIAAADRFIKLHPNHPNVDYAYYMRGLATFNERGVVERLTKQSISDRDPKSLRDSFFALKEVVTRYPESRYAKDATLRMAYLVNTLAAHELHVARYYMKRKAYVAALNRAKYTLETYPNSNSTEEALTIMISAYDLLGIQDLKEDALRVLKTNYPDSRMLTNAAPTDQRVWWKFWESIYN